MDLERVIALCRSFQAAELDCWVDGGWGVDALLGMQTRPHSDLDLAMRADDFPAFEKVLLAHGYLRTTQPDNPDWNRVFRDASGTQVDLHGFALDGCGNGILGAPEEGAMYPAGSLNGVGELGDLTVRCVAAPFVLQFRDSFEPRPVDYLDVAALCARFGLDLPSRFH